MRNNLLVALLVAGLAWLSAHPAQAAKCKATFNPIHFGNYDPRTPVHLDYIGQVIVGGCSRTPYTIMLDAGVNNGGNFFPRKMLFTTYLLSYNLFRDANHTEVWGDGSNGTYVVTGEGSGAGHDLTHLVYGRVNALQLAVPGVYTDSIVATFIY